MAEPIGEVACDRKGCDGVADVFKFKERSARGSQFKDKLWMKCRTCNRVSGRAGEQSVTNYILDEGKIWGAKPSELDSAKDDAPPSSETNSSMPEPSTKAKPSSPATPSEPKKKSIWDGFW